MTRIKHFVDEHPDLTGFVGFVVLVSLMGIILNSTESLTVAIVVGTAFVVILSLVARPKPAP
jgi:uncharacterized protein (DUF983 family)